MCSQVCLCVIERTIEVWTSVKVLYHERDRENGPLFQFKLCVTLVFRFAQRRPSDRCRWSSRGARHWGGESACMAFFFFGLRTIFVSRSDRTRKESKQTPVFVRSLDRIEEGKKKQKKHRQLWSEIDQTQGRASRAIDRAPAPERPRLRLWPSKPKAGIAVKWNMRDPTVAGQRSMEILDEKVNVHLPYNSTLKKFWNGFFQTFQAELLFFSGGK